MWIDATSAAGTVYDKKQSQVADQGGFAAAPTGSFKGGPTWLWSWNLAIPASSKQADAARQFVTWATSKEYVQLVAKTDGWVNAPPGTRASTNTPEYKTVAPFADFVVAAINNSNPTGQTKNPRPYTGAQFVGIPEFQAIGTQVGQTVASVLAGSNTVDQALSSAQTATARSMRQAGSAPPRGPRPAAAPAPPRTQGRQRSASSGPAERSRFHGCRGLLHYPKLHNKTRRRRPLRTG